MEEAGWCGEAGKDPPSHGKGVAMGVNDFLALLGLSADIFWWLRK
jgi:hypothetical protein